MSRGFEVVSKYESIDINIPHRSTIKAAGYDFESAVDIVLPSIWKLDFLKILWAVRNKRGIEDIDYQNAQKVLKPYLIPTGVKAYMGENEVLIIANRSSNPLKRKMVVPNGIGVVDADYYNNDSNEGEIFVQMINYGVTDVKIAKGDRIGQGIFMPFLLTDQDADQLKETRKGGFGSSGK